jgi:histidinol phosphatase-like enzyme
MSENSGTKTYCFDVDGVICTNTWGEYEKAEPIASMIVQINRLYTAGHRIILFTARGTTTGMDWRAVTEAQFARWGVKYHELMFGKPQADLYIDDRGMSLDEWDAKRPPETRV